MASAETVSGKVVAVTGGANGIGLAVVEHFLRKGAETVVILDLDSNAGNKVTVDLNAKYGAGKIIFIRCDVTNDTIEILTEIFNKVKAVDVFVNNAGIANDLDVKTSVDINLTSLMNWSVALWHHMRKDRGGAGGTIINIASIYGVMITPFVPVYHATKHGVCAFSRSLGHSFNYDRTGVRVVAVCPGFTRTTIVASVRMLDEEMAAAWEEEPKVWQEPGAVAAAAVQVFENSASGLAWQIVGNEPIVQV